MKLIEFAKKYIPKQQGHNEDIEFLQNIYETFESKLIPEDWEEFDIYYLNIKNNPNI